MTLRLLLTTSVVLLASAAPTAAGGFPLHGTFQTVITKAPVADLNGIWRVNLLPNGHYTIKRYDTVLIRGRDTQTATTISFGHETGPAACPGPSAHYRWSLSHDLLHLKELLESCLGRHVVLTTHPLLKTG